LYERSCKEDVSGDHRPRLTQTPSTRRPRTATGRRPPAAPAPERRSAYLVGQGRIAPEGVARIARLGRSRMTPPEPVVSIRHIRQWIPACACGTPFGECRRRTHVVCLAAERACAEGRHPAQALSHSPVKPASAQPRGRQLSGREAAGRKSGKHIRHPLQSLCPATSYSRRPPDEKPEIHPGGASTDARHELQV
jgi:hypothetical protein